MDRLGPLDSVFLHVEDGITHMHIASCAVFEGPPPAYDEFVHLVAAKLPQLPRYRQKVRFVPGHIGRPVWVDDPHFDLAYHVRHSALPPPGVEQELDHLMGRLMSIELDRDRPLWETWLVEGLAGDRWALISKVHHCMVDGISGTDLMVVLLDPSRETPAPLPQSWSPAPETSDAALVLDAAVDLLRTPAEQWRAVRAQFRRLGTALTALRDTAQGIAALGRELSPTSTLSIEGSIGPHRRWAAARARLEELKEIRRVFGVTVNDVVVSVIAGAFRDLLQARDDPVDGVVLRSLVPVSVRAADDPTPNNQVSAIIAELPVGVADPVERLHATHRELAALKASHQVEAGEAITSMAGLTPATLYTLALRSVTAAARRFPQRSVHTVTTNVPGPPHPLYAMGREMLEYLPYVPIAHGVRLGVAILSYNGQVRFGVTGDYDTVPEVEWFCRRIEANIAELARRSRDAVGARRRRPARPQRTAAPRPTRVAAVDGTTSPTT